jgi:hypothetical protein
MASANPKIIKQHIGRKSPPSIKPPRIYRETELDDLPEPTWQIEGMLPTEGFGVFFGAPEAFKSFVALDLAFCTALGLDWHGHAVRKGRVVYVAAEGFHGAALRKRAWKESRGITEPVAVDFIKRAVNLLDYEEMKVLYDSIKSSGPLPALIIGDTYNLLTKGANENDAMTASGVIASVRELNRSLGCALLLLHHPGHDENGRERGSSALRAGADLMTHITRKGMSVTVGDEKLDKTKDCAPFKPFTLTLMPFGESLAVVEDAAPLTLLDEVLNEVRATPGRSRAEVRIALKRGKPAVNKAIAQLIERGALTENASGLVIGTGIGTGVHADIEKAHIGIDAKSEVKPSGPIPVPSRSPSQSSGPESGTQPPSLEGGAVVPTVHADEVEAQFAQSPYSNEGGTHGKR